MPALLLLLALLAHGEELARTPVAREVFRAEGCWQCHAEVAGFPRIDEARRTGPLLERTPLPRSAEWHRAHLYDPRLLDPASTMPSYAARFRSAGRAVGRIADLLRLHDSADGGYDDDGVLTRREYERTGGEAWEQALASLDRDGDGVLRLADAAPVASPELEALISCLVAEGPEAPPPFAAPEPPPDRDPGAAISRGEALFQSRCAGCHGARADGQGPLAPFFGPQGPRNLRRGEFKLRSTPVPQPPLDEDIFRTIRQGAGPSMPAWPLLSDGQVWDLVEFVKSNHPLYLPRELVVGGPGGARVAAFTRANDELADASGVALEGGRVVKRSGRWFWFSEGREVPLEDGARIGAYEFAFGEAVYGWLLPPDAPRPPPEIPYSAESAAIGARVYAELQCGNCHGAEGRGDGAAAVGTRASLGEIVRPTDYTRGRRWLKSGGSARDLVRTFLAGMEGTPMPSFAGNFDTLSSAPAAEAPWRLAHFILRQAGAEGVPPPGTRRG